MPKKIASIQAQPLYKEETKTTCNNGAVASPANFACKT